MFLKMMMMIIFWAIHGLALFLSPAMDSRSPLYFFLLNEMKIPSYVVQVSHSVSPKVAFKSYFLPTSTPPNLLSSTLSTA